MVNAKMWPGSNTFQAIRATGPGLRGRSSLLLFTTDPLLCSIQILAPFYCWSYCSHIKAWVKVINALLLWPEQLKCRFYGRMPLNHGWEVMKEGKCTDQGHSLLRLWPPFAKCLEENSECESLHDYKKLWKNFSNYNDHLVICGFLHISVFKKSFSKTPAVRPVRPYFRSREKYECWKITQKRRH